LRPELVYLLGDGQEVAVRLVARRIAGDAPRPGPTAAAAATTAATTCRRRGSTAMLGSRAGPIGTAKDGVQIRSEKEVERPTACRIDGLTIVLIDRIEIRTLLTVDENGDEGFIEKLSDAF